MYLLGPLFRREALTAPRQMSHFLTRAGYVGGLAVLVYTATQTTFGFQAIRNISQISRFGSLIFQLVALVQLLVLLFFSVLFAAGNVANEKDRRTLLLLLTTDLRNRELVLGKLCASLLLPAVLWAISIPVFLMIYVLGGVSLGQIAAVLAITAAATFASGAWGALVAFWREKTFQTLAISFLGLVAFLAVTEGLGVLLAAAPAAANVFRLLDPFRGLMGVLDPWDWQARFPAAMQSVAELATLGAAITLTTILRLRIWNPSRSITENSVKDDEAAGRVRQPRKVWEQPVIWREMRTRGYGRKVLVIKLAYVLLAGFLVWSSLQSPGAAIRLGTVNVPAAGGAFDALCLLSLMLINTQAVTSITSERDAATLELLLATEITPKEFVYGKLGGVLYNTKELIATPWLLLAYLTAMGVVTVENFIYVTIGFLTLVVFAAMLGLHAGLNYGLSRTAIANSLGTMFFLFVGIVLCLVLILQARSSYALQLPSFLVFIVGGSLALGASLNARTPAPALWLSAWVLPFCMFYVIVSFLQGQTLGVCLFITAAYGFTAIAMLVPAVSEFDIALGKRNAG
jgi:ABC-type transport system involved in multi-copper enzyme maturation permease subunit